VNPLDPRTALSRFVDSQAGRRVREVVARAEGAQAEAVVRLADALDETIHPDLRTFDRETRMGELHALGRALGDSDALREWYAEHRLPDPDLATYVDLAPEEWDEQIGAWAARYRETGDYGDYSDRDLAEAHVRRAFDDVESLAWVEDNVVGIDEQAMIRDGFTHYFELVERETHRLAEAVEARPVS
jgi:hypothetical protein